MQNVPDPYRLLGVSRDATGPQIKAAHRRLAKRYHPDAPGGDQGRFLAVQEAYQLLADPVRRRDWDARHEPGPVRADARAARVTRTDGGRRPSPNGPRRGPDAARDAGASAGSSASRSGSSWSARNVPWWEGREATRRRAGPEVPPTEEGRGRARSSPRGRSTGPGDRGRGPRGRAGEPSATREDSRSDFDVYSRSSGAAWSSAARAYYRKGVDDLPRGRAAWANRPRPKGPSAEPWGAAAGAGVDGARTDAGRDRGWSTSPNAHGSRDPGAAGPASRDGARAAGTAPPPRFTAQGPHPNLARARHWAVAGRGQWPPAFQRLVFAVAGWLPPALALAYTAATATGCDRAAVSCPPNFELVQVAAVAVLLAGLLALPRAAYLAAAGSAGLGITALLLVVVYGVVGVPQPLPDGVAMLTLATWLLGYIAGVVAARHDWPFARPWLREGWIVGPDGRPPSLGVAHRAPRG